MNMREWSHEIQLVEMNYFYYKIMNNRKQSLLLIVVFLSVLLYQAQAYSCATANSNGWLYDTSWANCYEQYNGNIAGKSEGSMTQCWWGQCGDWYENYNSIRFFYTGTRYSHGCYYTQNGRCRTCCDGCCCGCSRDCFVYWYEGGYYYYDWRYGYTCSGTLYVHVYHPCHPYCATCTVKWNLNYCQSCHHTIYRAYQWLNWPDTGYQVCENYCPNRNWDNAYRGQYIADVNDLVCSWCNTTCSTCENLQGGGRCRTCITSAYLLASNSLCTLTFPLDSSNCQLDYYCVSPCPTNLYFGITEAQAKTVKYDWCYYNSDTLIRQTNVCYLCHRYCLRCYDKYDYTCYSCAGSYYKWQQYTNRCNYYCPQGQYTAGGLVGEYIDSVYSIDPHRRCATCDAGCYFCTANPSNCFMCQDNYFLLDDMAKCLSTFTCAQCQLVANGGIVTDGCHTRDKYCRLNTCPEYFYFKVYRTGYTGDLDASDNKYNFFTQETGKILNYGDNGYASSSNSRYTNTSTPSPYSNVNTYYRRQTNFCKLCDFRCMKCTGPTNFQCSLCVNNYYKWTNDTVCESYCPTGQYQRNISTSYPNNETTCANCDLRCRSCQGWDNNCSSCTIFPNTNYAFLYSIVMYNATCIETCPTSPAPLTQKGFYGSIGSMTCYACPGGCSNCNIDFARNNYAYMQSIVCGSDFYCTKGIVCTACLQGYSLVGGACVDQTTCRLYSYYVQGASSASWSPSGCTCLDGYYFSGSITCSNCDVTCLTCNGPDFDDCVTCPQGFKISSGQCVSDFVYRSDYWNMIGSTVNSNGFVGNNYNNYQNCGSYRTLFGFRSAFSTSSNFYYSSPLLQYPNFYAITVRLKVLFIDQWQSTAGLYFRLNSATASPFATYLYNNKGAIGQMQCGTNANDYLLTLSAKASLAPSGYNNSYTIYVNSNKNPVQNSTGFYYYWGLHDAVFTVLQCHSSCSTCSGPASNQCTGCSNTQKVLVDGKCLCNTASNYFYSFGAAFTDSCIAGCPVCTYTAGQQSTGCYYRDYTTRMCVNPPTNNCSAPFLYGQPYELTNSYGTCRQNCSSGYYAIESLMKCTTNCAQFSLYYYSGASAFGATMSKCVATCPSGLIAHPATMWCVIRCPSGSTNYFLQLQNRTTDPKCTSNCTTGYEYLLMNECVQSCPSGYFTQTISTHNKCVQKCTNAFGDNITRACVLFCPTPSFADPYTNLCAEQCTNGTYQQIAISNGNRTCVSVCQNNQWLHPYYLNCSRNPMDCPEGTYANNHSHKCQPSCDPLHDQVGENTTRLCQKNCNTGFAYWAAGLCVSICPENPSLWSYVSGTLRVCVSSCNSSSTGLFADKQANRSCVATCSQSPKSTFGDVSTNKCQSLCTGSKYGNPNHPNRLCVSTCEPYPVSPVQTYAYDVTKLCVLECPEGYYGDNYTTSGKGICDTNCPSPYFGDPTINLCVSRCSFRYFGIPTGDRLCTLVCPAGYYGINQTSNRICTTTCDNGFWGDNFTRLCYNVKTSCSNFTYADSQRKYCVEGPNCTAGTYADPLTMGCESKCTNTSMFGDPSTNLCVSLCPSSPDYYSQDGYCTATCNNSRSADWQANRSCVVTCSSSPVPLYSNPNYRCITANQCWNSHALFASNTTRRCQLCSGALPFGDPITRQCVFNCPMTYYGDLMTNLCVLQCNFSRLLYADNATFQCTTLCTLGTFGVNSTFQPLCQKECPANSYALDSIRVCVSNCGPGFFGDPITGKCYNSSLNCSEGYYGNDVSNMCVLPQYCQTVGTLHYYADNTTKMCISKCNSPQYGQNTTYTCVGVCSEPYFGENTTRMCIIKSHCALYFSFADDQLNLCVSNCSTAPVYTFAQNVTYTCVTPANCPPTMYAENISQSCVYYCPNNGSHYSYADDFKTNRCLDTCFDVYYGDISSGYGICSSSCPGGNYFRDNRTQICTYVCPEANSTLGYLDTYGDSTTDLCVIKCPLGWYAQTEINRTCVQTCMDGTWGNKVTRICISNPVLDCPPGTWGDNFTHRCESSCSSNSSNGQLFYGQNITRLCVSSCPVPSFAYTVTLVCIDICPFTVDNSPGYFGDPDTLPTRLCVTNCLTANLYRDRANNRTCQPSCTFNSTYKLYKDPTTFTCVSECPTYPQHLYATGTNSSTASCQSSCVIGYMYDGNMSCVSSCPELLDPTTNRCVSKCPFSSALNSTLFANKATNTCVVATSCPNSTYASEDLLQCVSTCPSNTYISGKYCLYVCPDNQYINPVNQSCVTATNCPANYFGNNQTRSCVQICTNGTFADTSTKTCLTRCYSPSYGDQLTGVCNTSCSNGLIKNDLTRTCVSSCSPGLFYSPNNGSCLSVCYNPYFADSTTGACVSRCTSDPITYATSSPSRSCVTTCPSTAKWYDMVNRVCTSTCPGSTYQFQLNVSCLSYCPEPYYIQGTVCNTSCASTSQYADDTTRSCTSTCPTGYFKDPTTFKCVIRCPDSPVAYFAENNSKSCMTSCPNNSYADTQSYRCVATCSINPVITYAQPNTRKCVVICPATYSQFADPVTQKCVTTCTSGYFADNRQRMCIRNCSNIYYADSLTTPPSCVSTCSPSTFADPLLFKCVTNCSAGYFSYSPNATCVQFCPFGYFGDRSSFTCVQQCRDTNYPYADSLIHQCTNFCSNEQHSYKPIGALNGSCLYSCPGGYFSDPTTMSCVLKCPNGYFGEAINNTCMKDCSESKFKDSINNLCQSQCPAANNLFGEPYARQCVTNCTNTGKSFLYADTLTRRCSDVCSGAQFANPPTFTCVSAGLCSSGRLADPYYKLCVTRCYNNTYAYQGACYSSCPVTTVYADDASQSCVIPAGCTSGLFADPTKGRCVQFCDIASNRYADDYSRTCAIGCDSPWFADNITRRCVTKCPSVPQYYGLNSSRLCLQNCPQNTYGDPTLNLCVLKCSNGYYGDKLTWTCVTACPLGYFSDDSSNMCVTTCLNNLKYFGDPFTFSCTFNCTNGLYADSLSNRECVSTCASPNFAQNSTMTCVGFCLTGFADPTTRQCIATCSKGYYGYSRVCYEFQCPSTTPIVYADDLTNTCVSQCPPGTFGQSLSRKCVPICPIASGQFADTTDRVCRTDCLSGTYADSALRMCVTTCSSTPALYSFTVGNLCVVNCTNGLYADNSTRSCASGCPNGTYADNSTYRCVFICPSKPMMWGDNHTNTCVYRCSSVRDRYADNQTRTCVINCPNGTYADPVNRICNNTCPNNYFGVNSTRRCQLGCPNGTFANPLNRICVTVCPVDPIYYGDTNDWKCKTACPNNSFANPRTQQCVDNVGSVSGCPNNYFSDSTTKLCVQVCPMKHDLYADPNSKSCKSGCAPLMADNSTMRCVSRCPTYPNYYANLANNRCVFYCPAHTYADNSSRTCVTQCPNGTYAQNSTWRCVSRCLNSPLSLRDSLNWKCVDICPPNYFADYFNLICVLDCPDAGSGFQLNDTRECVKTCPNGSYAFLPTRTCVSECYNGTFADNDSNSCVETCPRDPALYADSLTMSCVSDCPNGTFSFENTRQCVIACPDPTYYRQNSSRSCVQACDYKLNTYTDDTTGYCVYQCSNGTFADPSTKRCVSKCPDQPMSYAQNISRTCVPVCPNNTFGENKTRICVASCPSGSLSYPQNRLCVFNCPIGYYAYIPTQFCVDRCQPPFFGDPSTRTCVQSCPINQLLYADNTSRTCVKTCPGGSYAYQWEVACLPDCPLAVPPIVQTYAADYDNTCTEQCDYPYFSYPPTLKCVSDCPDPYYNNLQSHTCELCPLSCTTCISATKCLGCVLGFYLQNGICVSNCTLIYYANPNTRTCVVSALCAPLFGVNSTQKCESSCPSGQYGNRAVYRCDACPSTCVTCTSLTNCISCVTASVSFNNYCYGYCNSTIANFTGIYYTADNKTCTTTCPNGTYATIVYCKLCASQCLTCTGTATNCTNCTNGLYIFNNVCVTQCPDQYKPVSSRACVFCNTSCGSGLTYQTNVTSINGQTSMFVNFNQGVNINGNLYDTFKVSGGGRLLQSGISGYQIVVIDSNTVQIIFPPGTSQSNFNFQITNPQNVVGPNGELPSSLTAQIALDISNMYSSSVDSAPSSFSTYFTFLSLICLLSFIFDVELMRFLQLLYVHYFVIMALPPHLFKVFSGLRFSTLYYLPRVFPVERAVLRPNVPDTVFNAVGDYNFLRNAGFAFTPLLIILVVWGLLKLLSVPEINRFKNARVWCRQALEKRFKYAVFFEWVSLFITNTALFAFLQLRDYEIYDTFSQVGLVLAHFIIIIFVVICIMLAYRVISFHREHPTMSENIKKASQIILKDEEADQLVSTNVFLSQKKKIDLRDMYYPQINNQNIFPFRCVYKYSFLALLCPNVLYLRAILLAIFIGLAHSSVQLQMGLAIPLNILTLLYFSRARPYTFKFKKYRIKNYIVIYHEVCLIIFEFLMLSLGVKDSAGATAAEKEQFSNYIVYYLAAVCTVSFIYQIFIIIVFIYRKIWLRFIETDFFKLNFSYQYAKYQAAKNKGKKLAKTIDPKAKEALKNLIKGYKKSRSVLRPNQSDKANPQLPAKYKITYFDRTETSSQGSRTTLTKRQKKQMLKEIFGQEKQIQKEEEDAFEELRDESQTIEPEYQEYEEEIEIRAKDLAKYVANSNNLLKMKKSDE